MRTNSVNAPAFPTLPISVPLNSVPVVNPLIEKLDNEALVVSNLYVL